MLLINTDDSYELSNKFLFLKQLGVVFCDTLLQIIFSSRRVTLN